MIKVRFYIDPYRAYAISFLLGILLFSLGWSGLYPSPGFSLMIFLALTIFLHIAISFRWHSTTNVKAPQPGTSAQTLTVITVALYLLWIADFIHAGGVPLFKILMKHPYNYRSFGMPSLHVFTVTIASFFCAYLLHVYSSSKNKVVLLLYVVNMMAAILIYNRGMLIFNVCSSMVLYVMVKQPTLGLKHFIYVAGATTTLLYLFGVLGSLRVSREAKVPYDNTIFLAVGSATDGFKNAYLPNEFFWTYVYASSPIANLQQNTNDSSTTSVGWKNLLLWINNEILPDFVSKRINQQFSLSSVEDKRIEGPFNVSTIYSKSYSYLGWWGMIGMAFVIIVFPVLYKTILPMETPYGVVGLAILTTLYFFMAFDNTLKFTGLSFQLVYPVAFGYGYKFFNHRLRRV
jgi:hypothetical protein